MNEESFAESLSGFAEQMQFFTLSAIRISVLDIENIISNKITDNNIIERALDSMLDYAHDEAMLIIFKKLCRYYWNINREATAYYINSYREMWDEDYNEEENAPN